MRRWRPPTLLLAGFALIGCASGPRALAQAPAAVARSDLGTLVYDAAPHHAAPPHYVASMDRAVSAVTAYVAAEPSGYALDAGDKLRAAKDSVKVARKNMPARIKSSLQSRTLLGSTISVRERWF